MIYIYEPPPHRCDIGLVSQCEGWISIYTGHVQAGALWTRWAWGHLDIMMSGHINMTQPMTWYKWNNWWHGTSETSDDTAQVNNKPHAVKASSCTGSSDAVNPDPWARMLTCRYGTSLSLHSLGRKNNNKTSNDHCIIMCGVYMWWWGIKVMSVWFTYKVSHMSCGVKLLSCPHWSQSML